MVFGFPVHRPNVLSRFGNSGMLVVFSLSGYPTQRIADRLDQYLQLETDDGLRNLNYPVTWHPRRQSRDRPVGTGCQATCRSWVKFGGWG